MDDLLDYGLLIIVFGKGVSIRRRGWSSAIFGSKHRSDDQCVGGDDGCGDEQDVGGEIRENTSDRFPLLESVLSWSDVFLERVLEPLLIFHLGLC